MLVLDNYDQNVKPTRSEPEGCRKGPKTRPVKVAEGSARWIPMSDLMIAVCTKHAARSLSRDNDPDGRILSPTLCLYQSCQPQACIAPKDVMPARAYPLGALFGRDQIRIARASAAGDLKPETGLDLLCMCETSFR